MRQVSQAIEAKLTAPLLATAVKGVYTVTPTGDLLINITSHAPRTILVTGLTILWSDNTTTTLDRWNNTATANTQLTITHPDGTTETIEGLPAPLAPGDTLTIILQGCATNRQPTAISASLSASPIVAVIPITPPTPTANITPAPQPQAQLLAQLNYTAYNWAITWSGQAYGATLQEAYAQPQTATLLEGTNQTPLNPQALNSTDDNTIIVAQSRPIIVLTNFTKTTNNTIYADDFNDCNAINSGRWVWRGGLWSDITEGFNGCGIEQNQTYADTSPPSGWFDYEYMAAPNTTFSFLQNFYVYVHVKPMDNGCFSWLFGGGCGGTYDIVIYSESEAYRLSLVYNSTDRLLRIYYFNGTYWYIENYTIAGYVPGAWYGLLLYFNSATGILEGWLYNASSSEVLAGPIKAQAISDWTPSIIGLGTGSIAINIYLFNIYIATYYLISSAFFDDVIVSKANPLFLNFTLFINGLPAYGYNITVLNQSGTKVGSGITDSNGDVSIYVGSEPILLNPIIEIYDPNGNLTYKIYVNRTGFTDFYHSGSAAVLYGGERYVISLSEKYVVSLESSSVITSSNAVDIKLSNVMLVNTTSLVRLLVYNWTSGSWILWYQNRTVGLVNASSVWFKLGSGVVNSSNDTVLLRVEVLADAPVNVSVDMLNAIYRYWVYSSFNALLVGIGGSNIIEVYSVEDSTLDFLYSPSVGSLFNGSTVFGYDNVSRRLILFNSTGIYNLTLSQAPNASLLTSSCTANENAELAIVSYSSVSYAVAIVGGSNDIYCIVNLETGEIVSRGSLSSVLGFSVSLDVSRVYAASAANDSRAFFLVYDEDAGEPVIVEYDAATGGWRVVGPAPGGYVVGMAYGGGYLWLLLKGGSLYRFDPTSGSYELVVSNLPFYPWEPGDRLEYIPGLGLVFVRDDGTREVWLIPA